MKVKGLRGQSVFWKPKLINWDKPSTASNIQNECKKVLALYWLGDIVAEEQLLPGTKLRFDFVNFSKKIIVEVQGEQHSKLNKFFHNNNVFNFVSSLKRDEKKREFAALNNITYIEVKTVVELHKHLIEL